MADNFATTTGIKTSIIVDGETRVPKHGGIPVEYSDDGKLTPESKEELGKIAAAMANKKADKAAQAKQGDMAEALAQVKEAIAGNPQLKETAMQIATLSENRKNLSSSSVSTKPPPIKEHTV